MELSDRRVGMEGRRERMFPLGSENGHASSADKFRRQVTQTRFVESRYENRWGLGFREQFVVERHFSELPFQMPPLRFFGNVDALSWQWVQSTLRFSGRRHMDADQGHSFSI